MYLVWEQRAELELLARNALAQHAPRRREAPPRHLALAEHVEEPPEKSAVVLKSETSPDSSTEVLVLEEPPRSGPELPPSEGAPTG